MNWLKKLFSMGGSSSAKFRSVDWLEVEGRLRSLEALTQNKDQLSAKDLILQSDNLIDFVLKSAGIRGQTMGERLKNLKTLLPRSIYQKAWSVHLKRNELVHETGSFVADWEKQTNLENAKSVISALRGLR
ncbi:MAG TPA: hypothetical protein VMQ44_00645 [Candidatus Saccharimonadales bacterium]|nr:hypothetical protein [Candidatus Saccharimonadales bacterium]